MFELYTRIDALLWHLVTTRKICYNTYRDLCDLNMMEYEAFIHRIY